MISWIIILSIVAYIPFYIWDRRHMKDEREQLIELKTSSLQSHVTLLTLIILAVVYYLNPDIPAWICLISINIANLYSEVLGKVYFRARI